MPKAAQVAARGVLGTLDFEWAKSRWNWGDSTFWSYQEGKDAIAKVTAHGSLTATVMNWNHPGGTYFHLHTGISNGIWFGFILISGCGPLLVSYRRDIALLAVALPGIALFTLLLQGRSRYLLPFVPVVSYWCAHCPVCGSRRTHAAC